MRRSRGGSIVPLIIVIGTTIAYWQYAKFLLLASVAIVAIKVTIKIVRLIRFTAMRFELKDIDAMDGLEFERYVADLLRRNGYSNVSMTERYDYGVDIIADRDGIRWGIQVKRYSGLVKAAAIRQVVAGLNMYGCDQAMVITNSTYSTVAGQLAAANNCLLIDRRGLYEMSR